MEIKFEDIKKANESIVTLDVKGNKVERIPRIQKNGYKTICYRHKKYYLHRIIMETFLNRNLKKHEQIHHINGNKLDNDINNLKVVNFKEHQRDHAIKNKLGKGNFGKEPINKAQKVIINLIKKLRNEGYSYKEIKKETGVSRQTAYKYVKEN